MSQLSYEQVTATINELDTLTIEAARAMPDKSKGYDVLHGAYLCGLLQGMMIAGQPVNTTVLHQRWLEAARMVARMRESKVAA